MSQKTVLILGLGISGRASAALLLKHGFSVVAVDRKAQSIASSVYQELQALLSEGKNFAIFPETESFSWDRFSFMVVSPGIASTHPLIVQAKAAKIEIIGEIELAFRYLQNAKIFGVTGSNGKTTTVLLAAHILKSANIPACALGNVGTPLSAYAMQPHSEETLIVELSSFQLETLSSTPRLDAAMILNILPNHLDRYSSMNDYASAKLRIQSCLKEQGSFFVSRQVAQEYFVQNAVVFDLPLNFLEKDRQACLQRGIPECENQKAAQILCSLCGVSKDQFEKHLKTFQKPPHRIEWVDEINGVDYYNDSKASNIEAVMHAVRLFEKPLILLAGGVDKGSSYYPWVACFAGKVKQIVVFGKAADKIQQELGAHFPVRKVKCLQDAFYIACEAAACGDAVLLSPGCSSFDQFVNFEERGDAFKKMVYHLKRGCNGS